MDDPLRGEVEIMKGNEVIKGKGSKKGMGVNQREVLESPLVGWEAGRRRSQRKGESGT